nr:hypothetical protein [Rhodospirillales bacterium]
MDFDFFKKGGESKWLNNLRAKKRRRFSIGKARWIALGLLAAFLFVRVWDPGPLQTVRVKTFDFFQQ